MTPGRRVVFTSQPRKDTTRLAAAALRPNAQKFLDLLANDPFASPPRFEKLVGDLAGAYS